MQNLRDRVRTQLQDLYSAESQLVKTLPKMAEKATYEKLKNTLNSHHNKTKEHINRLKEVSAVLGFSPKGKECKGMKGLLEEASEITRASGDKKIIDDALIGEAQKVEHYEITSYRSIVDHLEFLEHRYEAKTLKSTLDEEKKALGKLEDLSDDIHEKWDDSLLGI